MSDEKKKKQDEAQAVIIDQAFEDLSDMAEIFHGKDLFSILGTIFFFGIVTVMEQVEGASDVFKEASEQAPYEA